MAHQPEQHPLDPPGAGAGKIDRDDLGLGLLRQPLVTEQCLRPPSRDLACVTFNPRPRHLHSFRPEGADELPFAVPVAIAFRRDVTPVVAKTAEKAAQFLFENGLDGCADVGPEPLFDRVEPGLSGGCRRRLGGWMFTRRLRRLQISTNSKTRLWHIAAKSLQQKNHPDRIRDLFQPPDVALNCLDHFGRQRLERNLRAVGKLLFQLFPGHRAFRRARHFLT